MKGPSNASLSKHIGSCRSDTLASSEAGSGRFDASCFVDDNKLEGGERPEIDIVHTVRAALKARTSREDYFPNDICDGASWNILTDLFLSHLEGRTVCISSSCIASRAASTTALRHVNELISKGWCRRVSDASDRRRSWLVLTEKAIGPLSTYFGDLNARSVAG